MPISKNRNPAATARQPKPHRQPRTAAQARTGKARARTGKAQASTGKAQAPTRKAQDRTGKAQAPTGKAQDRTGKAQAPERENPRPPTNKRQREGTASTQTNRSILRSASTR